MSLRSEFMSHLMSQEPEEIEIENTASYDDSSSSDDEGGDEQRIF